MTNEWNRVIVLLKEPWSLGTKLKARHGGLKMLKIATFLHNMSVKLVYMLVSPT